MSLRMTKSGEAWPMHGGNILHTLHYLLIIDVVWRHGNIFPRITSILIQPGWMLRREDAQNVDISGEKTTNAYCGWLSYQGNNSFDVTQTAFGILVWFCESIIHEDINLPQEVRKLLNERWCTRHNEAARVFRHWFTEYSVISFLKWTSWLVWLILLLNFVYKGKCGVSAEVERMASKVSM